MVTFLQEVCSLLRDPQQFACYHREFNGDDDILMEDWRVSHSSGESSWERSVTYNLRLDVPGMVKRAIGAPSYTQYAYTPLSSLCVRPASTLTASMHARN